MSRKTAAKETTFGELEHGFKASPEFGRLAASTQSIYSTYLDRAAPLRGRPAAKIGRGDIYKIWESHANTPGAQSAAVKVIRRVFGWGLDNGKIETAPLLSFKSRHKNQPRMPWSEAEIETYRKAAEGYIETNHGQYQYVLDSFEIALETGQRISDILQMRMSGWDGSRYQLKQQKTGKLVRFTPGPTFAAAIKRNTGERYVLGDGKTAISYPRWAYHFNAIKEIAGVDKSFHGLRKNVAVWLRENGASDAQAAALLGHRTPRMVQAYAQEADAERLASSAITVLINREKK